MIVLDDPCERVVLFSRVTAHRLRTTVLKSPHQTQGVHAWMRHTVHVFLPTHCEQNSMRP